jgi:hypothetical protein
MDRQKEEKNTEENPDKTQEETKKKTRKPQRKKHQEETRIKPVLDFSNYLFLIKGKFKNRREYKND